MKISPIPKTAPFAEDEIDVLNRVVGPASATQRAWLAGFLAGLDAATPTAQPAAPPGRRRGEAAGVGAAGARRTGGDKEDGEEGVTEGILLKPDSKSNDSLPRGRAPPAGSAPPPGDYHGFYHIRKYVPQARKEE